MDFNEFDKRNHILTITINYDHKERFFGFFFNLRKKQKIFNALPLMCTDDANAFSYGESGKLALWAWGHDSSLR